MPAPDHYLDPDEVDEVLWKFVRIFGKDLISMDNMIAVYWLYSIETCGTVREASSRISLDASTGWRYLKRTGLSRTHIESRTEAQ